MLGRAIATRLKLEFMFSTANALGVHDGATEWLFVSCPAAGTIEVLDVPGHKLLQSIKLTPGVDGLAWAPAI